jgi:ATP phosphoribosyltransferase
MLRLAIQKSGRLTEDSRALISECGIELERTNGKLRIPAHNFPLELLLVRDDDIPRFVAEGIVHAAIVGENLVAECKSSVKVVRKLGFGRCRLALAVPRGLPYHDVTDLSGKRIATSYPNILCSYLESKGVEATIFPLSGSVEVAPGIGVADAICDLVSSGSTLLTNGLREVEHVFSSEAVLIVGDNVEYENTLARLDFRIKAHLSARRKKYILLNIETSKVPRVVELLPGLSSPSVLSLQKEGWSSVHSVVYEDNFWELIDELMKLGAEGVLVLPIEKLIY